MAPHPLLCHSPTGWLSTQPVTTESKQQLAHTTDGLHAARFRSHADLTYWHDAAGCICTTACSLQNYDLTEIASTNHAAAQVCAAHLLKDLPVRYMPWWYVPAVEGFTAVPHIAPGVEVNMAACFSS